MIVGDGIQEGAESLAAFLQQHAGFHFTLALVELKLFEVPGGGFIVQSSVPARTTNIDRGIVTIQEGQIVISPPVATASGTNVAGRPTSISQERYFEVLETEFPDITPKFSAFLDTVAEFGVFPEFGSSNLILRWISESGKKWSLGTISSTGTLILETLGQQSDSVGLLDEHTSYLKKLNNLVPGSYIKETPKKVGWYVSHNGKYPTVDALLADAARREGWARAIAEFQGAVKDFEENGSNERA